MIKERLRIAASSCLRQHIFWPKVKPSSTVSIQMQSLVLRALRKRKPQPQEAQALALASSQSWLPLLRPSIPIGWRLRLLRENSQMLVLGVKGQWPRYQGQ